MTSFKSYTAAAEYARRQEADFKDFLKSIFPDREKLYQKTDYYSKTMEKQREIDIEIENMEMQIQSQYTVFNYPHNWRDKKDTEQ